MGHARFSGTLLVVVRAVERSGAALGQHRRYPEGCARRSGRRRGSCSAPRSRRGRRDDPVNVLTVDGRGGRAVLEEEHGTGARGEGDGLAGAADGALALGDGDDAGLHRRPRGPERGHLRVAVSVQLLGPRSVIRNVSISDDSLDRPATGSTTSWEVAQRAPRPLVVGGVVGRVVTAGPETVVVARGRIVVVAAVGGPSAVTVVAGIVVDVAGEAVSEGSESFPQPAANEKRAAIAATVPIPRGVWETPRPKPTTSTSSPESKRRSEECARPAHTGERTMSAPEAARNRSGRFTGRRLVRRRASGRRGLVCGRSS